MAIQQNILCVRILSAAQHRCVRGPPSLSVSVSVSVRSAGVLCDCQSAAARYPMKYNINAASMHGERLRSLRLRCMAVAATVYMAY